MSEAELAARMPGRRPARAASPLRRHGDLVAVVLAEQDTEEWRYGLSRVVGVDELARAAAGAG